MAGEPAQLVAARLAHARAVKAGDPEVVRSTRDRYALERARWLVTQAGDIVAELDVPLKVELASALREMADALDHS
jgi:hypothetical protein